MRAAAYVNISAATLKPQYISATHNRPCFNSKAVLAIQPKAKGAMTESHGRMFGAT
jgi:hypothetical protein